MILLLFHIILFSKTSRNLFLVLLDFLNPIQDRVGRGAGGGRKAPPTSFSPVTSTYELVPKTFWLLVLTLLPHWYKTSRSYLVPVPNYWTSTDCTPQKHCLFWSNPYKIGVMITSVIEMLELPNFGHMITSTI